MGTDGASAEPLLGCPEIGLPRVHRGKVREMFAVGTDRMLMVATDRLSAFDVVFEQGIPGKGEVLTRMSELWFRATGHEVPNHFVSMDLGGLGLAPGVRPLLEGRSMVVRRAQRVDVECVVRGYLAGSGWKEYQASGTVCGIRLPAGLRLNERLPEPVFTPALKNDVGHDENVSFEVLQERVGAEFAGRLREASLRLYAFGRTAAEGAGIILADTKFEFGSVDGVLTLIDEVFTPDSSRFWPADRYRAGAAIDSLDKQPVRDFVAESGWNMEPPAPELPPEVVRRCSLRYREALERIRTALTGAGAR